MPTPRELELTAAQAQVTKMTAELKLAKANVKLIKETEEAERFAQFGSFEYFCTKTKQDKGAHKDHLSLRSELSPCGNGLFRATYFAGSCVRTMGLYLSPADLLRLSEQSFMLYNESIKGYGNTACKVSGCSSC